MIDVLLRQFAGYDYIAEVNKGELPINSGRGHVCGTLKCAGCVTESKLQIYEAVETMMKRKCSLIFFCAFNLGLSVFVISV